MNPKKQHGAAMVEFAIVALVFFMIIFGILEFGRWMFIWNTLDEATRRGARVAAVCKAGDANNYIKKVAVFGDSSTVSNSPVLNGLTISNVSVSYYGVSGNPLTFASPTAPTANEVNSIWFVEVGINYSLNNLIIPGINITPITPTFTTRLPMESLGAIPTGSYGPCSY